MILTTMGSEDWPRSTEGRAICLALAVYAFAVFGYVTAALASFFVGRDAGAGGERREVEGAAEVRAELASLREELRKVNERLRERD